MTTAAAFATLLREKVTPLVPSDAAITRLLAQSRALTAEKGKVLLQAGERADRLIYVHRGLIRYYYADPETGTERTGQFFAEGSVVTDVASFLTGAPGLQTFETIEPSTLLLIPRLAMEAGCDEDHGLERFARKMIESALIGAQRRAASLLNLAPEERYRLFVETRPEIARRVPQYLLASHLGIAPESLSRIRNRIARGERG